MTVKERIELLTRRVNWDFGYGHLPVWYCEQNQIDVERLALDHNWTLVRGVLTHSFHRVGGSRIDWQNVQKKDIKRLAKELKKK